MIIIANYNNRSNYLMNMNCFINELNYPFLESVFIEVRKIVEINRKILHVQGVPMSVYQIIIANRSCDTTIFNPPHRITLCTCWNANQTLEI